MEAKYLTIKDAAALLGVTPLTLRNWDKKGVLAAYRHPVNNYRLYSYADIENLLLELKRSRPEAVTTASAPVQKLEVRFEDETDNDRNNNDDNEKSLPLSSLS